MSIKEAVLRGLAWGVVTGRIDRETYEQAKAIPAWRYERSVDDVHRTGSR